MSANKGVPFHQEQLLQSPDTAWPLVVLSTDLNAYTGVQQHGLNRISARGSRI